MTTTTQKAEAPVLEVTRLGKQFSVGGGFFGKRLRALHDVSFTIRRREVVALVGESGSGKSTIARLLARLMPPSEGKILFKGRDVLAEEPRRASLAYRAQVQMIFQDPFGSLNPIHTIGHHLERPLLLHDKVRGEAELQARVRELLSSVELHPAADVAQKHPHQLSGGQRQRVAIARALAVDPELILADEPISMLDVSIRMGVLNLMDRFKEERGLSYLYITHDLASARYIADRTMVMYGGQIVERGPAEDVTQRPAHPYTQLLIASAPDPDNLGSVLKSANVATGGGAGRAGNVGPAPTGCPFSNRCPLAVDQCKRDNPALQLLTSNRAAACWRLDVAAPQVAGGAV